MIPLSLGGSHLNLVHMLLAAALAVLLCLLWLSHCRRQLVLTHHVFGLVGVLDWVLQLMHLPAWCPGWPVQALHGASFPNAVAELNQRNEFVAQRI